MSATHWGERLGARGALTAWLAMVTLAGCGIDLTPPETSGGYSGFAPAELVLDSATPADYIAGPFGETRSIELPDGVVVTVTGDVMSPGEAVTFDIGGLTAGERLTVEVTSLTIGFDPAVALFDANLAWSNLNDNSSSAANAQDAQLDFVVRSSTPSAYLVVSSSPRAETTGQFAMRIARMAPVAVPSPAPQVVYLEFGGADGVVIGRRAPVDVPPFSAASIDERLADDTEELMRLTVERIQADFTGYDVVLVPSYKSPPPVEPHSVIYFGSYSPVLLGVADSVDTFNALPAQEAIIFVDTFAVFMTHNPSLVELADALANVTSHEIGHLLGLHHTADAQDIMDVTATVRQLMTPQTFALAPLNVDTFPVGYQNAPASLLANVGGEATAVRARTRLRAAKPRLPWYDQGPGEPARQGQTFTSGGCDRLQP